MTSLVGATNYTVERGEPALRIETRAPATGIQIDAVTPDDEPEDAEVDLELELEPEETGEEAPATDAASDEDGSEDSESNGRRRRRRRRRRGRERDENGVAGADAEGSQSEDAGADDAGPEDDDETEARVEAEPDDVVSAEREGGEASGSAEDRNGRRRRRGRRGGRGRGRDDNGAFDETGSADAPSEGRAEVETSDAGAFAPTDAGTAIDVETSPEEPASPVPEHLAAANDERAPTVADIETTGGPEAERSQVAPEPDPEPVAVVLTPSDPSVPKRAGWWSRAKSVLSGE